MYRIVSYSFSPTFGALAQLVERSLRRQAIGTMVTVYVLNSESTNHFYTGQTNNLERRISEHKAGKSAYDRINFPLRLVYSESVDSRIEAVRLERYYKTGVGREKLAILIRHVGL